MKINVAEHISILLYDKERVIIPNLGGFCATYKPANIEKYGNVSPPIKEIYFDESLNFHDNVLIEDIVQKHQISYQEALTEVEKFVKNIKSNIGTKAIIIANVGRLYLDARNDIVLAPSSINFLEDSFGLPKISYYPISRNEEKAAILPAQEQIQQPKGFSIKESLLNLWSDPSARAVVIIVVLLIIIVPQLSKLANPDKERVSPTIIEDNQNVVDKDKTLKPFEEAITGDNTEEATIVPREIVETNEPEEVEKEKTPEKNLPVKPKTNNNKEAKDNNLIPSNSPTAKKYIISIGNFSTQKYANVAIKEVRDAGYEVYTKNAGVSHRVGILITCEPSEIDTKIVKIQDQFSGAWLMNR